MPILADKYIIAMCEALGVDPNKTRRFVIDATAGEVLTAHIEMHPGAELLDIALPVTETKVSVINKPEE